MKWHLFFAILAFLLLTSLPARAWTGVVVRVLDGDTVTVCNDAGDSVKIRLHGVDAPEGPGSPWKAQPYSRLATNFLKALLPIGSLVFVIDMGYDKYDRTVAAIVSRPSGAVVQEELLKAGMVWVYEKYCTDCRQWKALQEEARKERRGLWNWDDPVPPWEWRDKARQGR